MTIKDKNILRNELVKFAEYCKKEGSSQWSNIPEIGIVYYLAQIPISDCYWRRISGDSPYYKTDCGYNVGESDNLHNSKFCPFCGGEISRGLTGSSTTTPTVNVKSDDTSIPRRMCVDKWLPAEKAIYDAVLEIEKMGNSVGLTDAVNKLNEARELVADFIDELPEPYREGGEG